MFGIFIRSVGERTEKLCWESCRIHISPENIIIIRDVFPAHKAYSEMFEQAKLLNYDWFLGVDADVVLVKDWYELALQKRMEMEQKKWFVFSGVVRDKFLGWIDRGNHFYNGEHVDKALDVLHQKTKYMLKPESAICQYVGLEDPHYKDITIGYHGYEQYCRDIYYRFWMQAKRKREMENDYPFLKEDFNAGNIDHDFIIAKKGWSAGRESRFLFWLRSKLHVFMRGVRSDASLRDRLFSKQIKNIREKSELETSLEEFFRNRRLER